ncbi:hypothetical protein [uncultured phage MedDCM-OCT-S08-C159]|uniref:Uncharacterized protein n=1 Tax=uncultured phage MedDCM-OCT-S08-C159 TaxID=743571 RepID=D6PFN4_9CAUD|nr:hypothetical protein HOT84_gp05 [uncultured phage MedDCM-OCT-S08-C159]ADD94535.1 hypothetical protein [uncultured phage MedDCM-OCT-S08-C159]
MEYSTQGTTAASRYETLVTNRSTYDREAKDSSKLTIPSLIPEQTTGTRAKIKHLSKQQVVVVLILYRINY